jgi:hypothetical protein
MNNTKKAALGRCVLGKVIHWLFTRHACGTHQALAFANQQCVTIMMKAAAMHAVQEAREMFGMGHRAQLPKRQQDHPRLRHASSTPSTVAAE